MENQQTEEARNIIPNASKSIKFKCILKGLNIRDKFDTIYTFDEQNENTKKSIKHNNYQSLW